MERILFIQPKLEGIGGIEKVLPLIVSGIKDSGHKTAVATFFGGESDVSDHTYRAGEKIGGSKIEKIIRLFKRVFWLKKTIDTEQPTILIVSAHGAALLTLFLALFSLIKVPIIIYEHQSLLLNDFGYGFLRRHLYKKAAGFVAVSKGIESELLAHFPNIPTQVVYNPIVTCGEVDFTSTNNPIFVTASRIEFVKGVDILIDLFIKYKKQGGVGELHIYGEGGLKSSLRDLVSEEKEEAIKFMGVTNNICGVFNNVTAYLSAARNEALGVSLIEALSAGVPIIALDSPYGPREILEVDYLEKLSYPHIAKTGILFGELTNQDLMLESFVSALKNVIENRIKYTQPALKRASCFSVVKAVGQFEELITRVKKI